MDSLSEPWFLFAYIAFIFLRRKVVKGCKSGVAWKYAQTRTSLVHPSSEFPWNAAWLVRADEASTKQNLILRWAVQQLVSSPHPTGLSQNWGRAQKKKQFLSLIPIAKTQPNTIRYIALEGNFAFSWVWVHCDLQWAHLKSKRKTGCRISGFSLLFGFALPEQLFHQFGKAVCKGFSICFLWRAIYH